MKKTQPAGGCLGTLFAILVVLYVVFGMLWMFIKEHIGLIAVAAIIIGVLWYRSKMNKKDEEEESKGFVEKAEAMPKRFFCIVPNDGGDDIYIDLWTVQPYSDNCSIFLAYQRCKHPNGYKCVRVYTVICDDNMKLKNGKIGLTIKKDHSILYKEGNFDIDKYDTNNLYVQVEKDPNSVDHFLKDPLNTTLSYMASDTEGYKAFFNKLEVMTNDEDFINYQHKFDRDKYNGLAFEFVTKNRD